MARDGGFWRNAALIGVAHLVVLAAVARWSATAKKPEAADIVWIEGGAVGAPVSEPAQATLVQEEGEPPPTDPSPIPATEDQLTMPTPPVVSEVEEPTPQPTATPRVLPTPKPTPKSSPQPSPKKASAVKPSLKPTTAPKKEAAAKKPPKAPPPKTAEPNELNGSAVGAPKSAAVRTGGLGGRATGPGSASETGWYGNMLHDRFFGEWAQPKSAVASGAKMSTLVQLRIERDGRVSGFTIVRSSGNIVVDESVAAVAQKVARVDPPPASLGNAGHYEVKINFELSVE
jgi:TonB family protein